MTTRREIKAKHEAAVISAAVAELEFGISRLVAGLKALQESDGVKLMDTAWTNENTWQYFFERQQEILEKELAKILSYILATQAEA